MRGSTLNRSPMVAMPQRPPRHVLSMPSPTRSLPQSLSSSSLFGPYCWSSKRPSSSVKEHTAGAGKQEPMGPQAEDLLPAQRVQEVGYLLWPSLFPHSGVQLPGDNDLIGVKAALGTDIKSLLQAPKPAWMASSSVTEWSGPGPGKSPLASSLSPDPRPSMTRSDQYQNILHKSSFP